MNSYDVIGAAQTATQDQLRGMYLAALKANHPDRSVDEDDRDRRTQRTAALNDAWSNLRDERARKLYDASLGLSRAAQEALERQSRPSTATTPSTRAVPRRHDLFESPKQKDLFSLYAGPGAWMALALVGLIAWAPLGWMAGNSFLGLHIANWIVGAAMVQVVLGGRRSPLGVVLRFCWSSDPGRRLRSRLGV